MSGYFDDNFGHWEGMDDPDMVDFYRQVQRESVEKICKQCEQKVRIRPQYSICNSCADMNEKGYGF